MTSICIGCGCTDERACAGGCSWTRVDQLVHVGVCSNCIREVARWDSGDHAVSDAAHAKRIARCRTCKAQVIWFKTPRGSNMPVDAVSVNRNDVQLDLNRHISHFATCPQRRKAR